MAEKIRILQVTGSLRIGGLETVAVNLYRFCDRSKYAFDYVVYGDAVEPMEATVEELGGRVFHIPYPHKGAGAYLKALKKVMADYGPYDAVHSHSLFNSGLVMLAAKQMKIPVRISHGHSDRRNTKVALPRRLYNGLMRMLINRYTTQKVACSEGAGKYLFGKKFDEKVYIIRNGVCVDDFRYSPEKAAKIKAEFGWENNKIVGHIGRLAPVKNQKWILRVFALAYQKDPSLRLLIAGDGELKEQLQERIDRMGLSEVAVLAGTRTDTAALQSAFDVYMMASHYEGVSISLIEAQASGVNCLSSDTAATPATRISECLHLLSLSDSAEAWAEKLLELTNKPRSADSWEKVKESGYDIVQIVREASRLYGG
ncbi:MAG: glycosyltransferase family 1 protein [Ruminococcaceae bacterium]|nr:glycosyltransferase family 1 protein [Oscillospiraceae bacterium]